MGRDYYEILGVKQNATEDEIRRAYRKLAKQHHPDRNPDDPAAETKFKEVQQAYATLSDARKRAEYDRFGAAGVGQWSTDPRGQRVYQWGGGSAVRGEDLEDLFPPSGADDTPAFSTNSSAQAAVGIQRVLPNRSRIRTTT